MLKKKNKEPKNNKPSPFSLAPGMLVVVIIVVSACSGVSSGRIFISMTMASRAEVPTVSCWNFCRQLLDKLGVVQGSGDVLVETSIPPVPDAVLIQDPLRWLRVSDL